MRKIKKGIIYCRVSTVGQAEEGVSLDNQLEKCKKFLEVDDYEVVAIFREEGRSGRTEWRDEYRAMMEYVREHRNEIDGVCFYSLSRLGRNVQLVLSTINELGSYNINVLSVNEKLDTSNPFGRFALIIISALAQLESEQTAERVFDNMHFSVKNFGTWQGARFYPYGYIPSDTPDDRGNKPLVVIKEEAEQVKKIFDYYTNGLDGDIDVGGMKIAKKLNEDGERYLRNYTGKDTYNDEWTSKRVLDIIRNGSWYSGWYVWNKTGTKDKVIEIKDQFGTRTQPVMSTKAKSMKPVKETFVKPREDWAIGKGVHESIITEAVWRVAEAKLERKKNTNENLDTTRQPKHYLTGILVCPTCGSRMLASSSKRTSKKEGEIQEVYYKCQRASAGELCKHNVINEKYVLPAVKRAFFTYYPLLISRKIQKTLIAQVYTNNNIRNETYDEILKLENEINNLIEKSIQDSQKYDEGLLLKEELIIKKKKTDLNINEIRKKIDKLNKDKKEMLISSNEIESIKHIIHNYASPEEYFNSLDKMTQRNLLNEVIVRLEVNKQAGKKGKDAISIRRLVINEELTYLVEQEVFEILKNPILADAFLKLNAKIMDNAKMKMFSFVNIGRPSKEILDFEKEYNVVFMNTNTGLYNINLTSNDRINQLNPEDENYFKKVTELLEEQNIEGIVEQYFEALEKIKS